MFPQLIADDPELIEDFDVFLWGYPTKVVGRTPNIWEAAAQLQTELRTRLGPYQSFVLVGHSLGGLVIRALIVDALEKARIEDINRVEHIVSFATPNDGSQATQIATFFRITNKQVRDTALLGDTITKLRNEWIDRVYAPNIRPGEERSKRKIPLTAVIGLQDEIVTRESAAAFFRHPYSETVPGTHVTMKLPHSREDSCYLVLKVALQKALPSTKAGASDESDAVSLP